jgi:predicted phage terminase large subunit-like protein
MGTATARAEARVPIKTSPYWPQGLPGHNYPQAAFLAAPHREVLFGGAAGPGKTVGLLLSALQYVDVPGYSAILMRRTYRQLTLPGQLLDIARSVLRGKGVVWNDKESRYDFPSGARIVFGHLDSDRDLEDALGPEYQFIGWDELTQFPEAHYTELFARLRRPADPANPLSRVPLRMRSASNPGGRGHRWVKQRFMVERRPDRLFIPARLANNPGIDAASYVENLTELSPQRRRQMLDGDWDAKAAGAMFDRDTIEIVGPHQLPRAAERRKQVRYWDTAATQPTESNPDPDWTVGLLLAYCKRDDEWYVLDVKRARVKPGGVDKLVTETAEADGTEIPIVFEQEPGSSGKQMIHEWQRKLAAHSVRGQRSDSAKEIRAAPVASRCESGKLKLLEAPWNAEFLDELEDFPPPKGGHDDQVDGLSGAYRALAVSSHVRIDQLIEAAASQPTETGDLLDLKW